MYNFGVKNGLHGEMLRINDEHYHYKCEVPGNEQRGWLCDEKVAEIWYTDVGSTKLARNCMIQPEESNVLFERQNELRDGFVEDKYIFKVNFLRLPNCSIYSQNRLLDSILEAQLRAKTI